MKRTIQLRLKSREWGSRSLASGSAPLFILFLFISAFILTGCPSRAHLSKDFGQRNQEMQNRQLAHPGAPADASGPTGLSGSIGEKVDERYIESYKKPPESQGLTIQSGTAK